MHLIPERINRLLDELCGLIRHTEHPIPAYRWKKTQERFPDVASLDTSDWPEISTEEVWGGHREYFWFAAEFTIPPELDGETLVYRLSTKDETGWDALNPQFSLFVNGQLMQGMDVNHTEALVRESAAAGELLQIVLSAYTGNHNHALKLSSGLSALDHRTEQLYYDCKVPIDVAALMPEDDDRRILILHSVNQALNLLDLRSGRGGGFAESLAVAQEWLEREFYQKYCREQREKVYCVGHTHIDVAWLWTLDVTRDKTMRSFSTVLALMREYPEYRFMSSQPQLYQFVKENRPELYAAIQARAAEGRWEPEGGMWVEADCNLASGEALVRQILKGKRFFREEFGKECEVLWLPDVFGYSAALPQIMKLSGLKYFMTIKISWNETNNMPHDTFLWEGLDGSRVLTHFPPTRPYADPLRKATLRQAGFSTYNSILNPSEVMGSRQWYREKRISNETLISFGYGDGGGGPTREMLENQRRMARGLPGCPQTVIGTSEEFFHALEASVSGRKELPLWVGELYLEYHRGTYTSMARNKKYNRRAEFLYQNAEFFGVLSGALIGANYPQRTLQDGWETILLNQFHDILPGSSIKEVYDESKEQYEDILAEGERCAEDSLAAVTAQVAAEKGSLVVYNPNGVVGTVPVCFPLLDGTASATVYDGETPLAAQPLSDGAALFIAPGVPPKGYKTFSLRAGETLELPVLTVSPSVLENRFFRLELNEKGQFLRMYDKRAERELLPPGMAGGVLMSYEDKPHDFDAWDINHYYKEKSWEVGAVRDITVTETGPVRASVRITRPYLSSEITQWVHIYADIPRIDMDFEVDWKETQVLLRCLFPVDIHAAEATYDIQFGNVTRPAHSNTSWDSAKFEVCAHKWLDFSEDGYGLAVFNDCKYGCDVHDGVIGLTMLKAALYPNPEADRERHRFSYALFPHSGGWREAGVAQQAVLFNNPMQAVRKENSGGSLAECFSFISCESPNVLVEAVKQAEDGGGVIVRLHECHNRRTQAVLRLGIPPAAVYECDLMEENLSPLACEDGCLTLPFKPFEIKTLFIKGSAIV